MEKFEYVRGAGKFMNDHRVDSQNNANDIEKMDNHEKLPQRKSIRLKGYDYSQAGLYFITICTQNHLCLFGEIENGEMKINGAGQMIRKWWDELNHKYLNIELHEQIIMPNHFHGIIQIVPVGADLCACPLRVCHDADEHIAGEHIGSPLQAMIQWLKTMTTNEYIRGVKNNDWPRFNKKLWQRNYYEHIIRDENSYLKISEYIKTNPMKWQEDKYYEPKK